MSPRRERFLTVAEYADLLNLSPWSVRRKIRRSQIPAVDVNSGGKRPQYRIPESSIPTVAGGVR